MISNVAQIQRMFWIFKMDKNVGNVSLTVIFLCAIFGFSSCSLLVEVHSVRCMLGRNDGCCEQKQIRMAFYRI